MDIPRVTSPPSILVYDFNNSNHDRPRLSTRTSSNASMSFSKTPGPMSIPNSTFEPPPPLPPPRHVHELAGGDDLGWQWANSPSSGFGKSDLPTLKPGSSLYGGQDRRTQDPAIGADCTRRRSSASTIKLSPDVDTRWEGFRHKDEGLHGEKPLEQRNLESSSNAYDKQLVSRIGRPNTPPRSGSISGVGQDASPTTRMPFSQTGTHPHQPKSLSMSDGSLSSLDPVSRWVSNPQSAGVSPGHTSSATSTKSYMDFRSPSYDSNAPSSAIDSERYGHVRSSSRRSGSGSILNFDDTSSLASRSNRGSYDQNLFPEPDTDFPMEETGGMRQLHIDDRTPPGSESHSPGSKLGVKRRASREAMRDDKSPMTTSTISNDLFQRRASGHLSATRASPVHRFQPTHGSVSSTSSASMRNGSYASSTGLSAGGSSMTSMSSYDRLSPGGTSPSSELDLGHDSPYITSVTLDPSPRVSLSRVHHQRALSESKQSGAASARKMSGDATKHSASKLQGVFICECCPKKPKKFDSLDELHVHEMEKQYTCQYCHNRFKNKNEAERHQNSLHLRRHSWSCANLPGVEAAFHSSTSPTSPNTDVCGYCGDEFPNAPTPDWSRRVEHLTTVHKFGECNQAKKFFRADHFRQHLKHSHAGTSGKWTNMLENACMKDEPPLVEVAALAQAHAQSRSSSLSGPGAGGGGGGGGGSSSGGVRENTIDEVNDES
ncbi:MAG: hypothetical protein M1830_003193 [Pleopsidium flavum]|nr:MAG: hypothetical protein M1830_003193 [Pleopsidium flavum]